MDMIVTATGNINVCDKSMLQNVKRGAIICNIGHFDNEIDTAFMRESGNGRKLNPKFTKSIAVV